MAFGIGTVVGVLALLITTCGFLTRSFMEIIDEVGGESLEAMDAVGAGRLTTCLLYTSCPRIAHKMVIVQACKRQGGHCDPRPC